MNRFELPVLFRATVATIVVVGGVMLYATNSRTINRALSDSIVGDTAPNSAMTPDRSNKAYTVHYQCEGKEPGSMWLLAKDEARAADTIQRVVKCPSTNVVEHPDYWSKR